MRNTFAKQLYELMAVRNSIYLLLADLGYGVFNQIRLDYPDRVIDVGASEQLLMGAAIGLAHEGKIPIVYSITPFLLCRPFEMIRNYINEEKTKVILIGGGRDEDYGHLGFSHWAKDDKQIMNIFFNILSYWPEDKEDVKASLLRAFFLNDGPSYINLRK